MTSKIEGVATATSRLSQLLDKPTSRGGWGERHVTDVLSAAGFREGIGYERHAVLPDGGKPDFTIKLPKNLKLHLDVKVPQDNFRRYVEAENAGDPTKQEAARKAFVSNVDKMVKDLAGREYCAHADSVDVVVMCVPNDSIFEFMHRADPDLIDKAIRQRVVLCSGSTLFAVLAIVHQSVENFRLEQRTDEILSHLNGFKQEWNRFTTHLEKTDKQFGTFRDSWESLSGTRRRKLERSVSQIDQDEADTLGLKEVGNPLNDELDIAPSAADISKSAAAS